MHSNHGCQTYDRKLQTGSFDNLKYSKYNFRASIDADISKNFTVGLNISTDNRKDTKPNWKSDGDRDRMNDLYKGLLLRTKMIQV